MGGRDQKLRQLVAERADLDATDLAAVAELDRPLRGVGVRHLHFRVRVQAPQYGGEDLIRLDFDDDGRDVVARADAAGCGGRGLLHLLDASDRVPGEEHPLRSGTAAGHDEDAANEGRANRSAGGGGLHAVFPSSIRPLHRAGPYAEWQRRRR
jgi:hypothetical protein